MDEKRLRRRMRMVTHAKRGITFFATSKAFRPVWAMAEWIVFHGASAKGLEVSYCQDEEKRRVYSFIADLRDKTGLLLANNEAYQIYSLAKSSVKVEGCLAEVGVYRGGSARIICEVKGDRSLYLFDTFQGLPEAGQLDARFQKGQFDSAYEYVQDLLAPFPHVHIHKGYFPETAGPVENETFAFVHLDVDTYESTTKCIRFFYPRMSRGGAILSHDYATDEGVFKAFNEFFSDKPEMILEVAGSQCLVIKS